MKATRYLFILLAVVSVACHSNADKIETISRIFCLTDTLQKIARIDTIRIETVQHELKLTGKVSSDEDKLIKVYPLVGGSVTQVKAELGDYVKQGEVLAVLKSSEIADYEQQMIAAQSNLLITKKNMDVAEDMFKSGLMSEKEYVTAQREHNKAEAELNRIKQVFKIYGVGTQSDYAVKAPISGFVVEKKINPGMQIRSDNNEPAFTISSLNEIWVMANVYESDIARVQLGYDAQITTISYPDQVFTGKIDKIFNVLDPVTKVMKVRIKLPNDNYQLKPEMYANIKLSYTGNERMIAIPGEAVIFDKNKNFVMVYHNRCNIETREVEIYKITGDKAYIKSGLGEHDRIISKYQLLVYDSLND